MRKLLGDLDEADGGLPLTREFYGECPRGAAWFAHARPDIAWHLLQIEKKGG